MLGFFSVRHRKFLFHSMQSLRPVNCLQIENDPLSQLELYREFYENLKDETERV
jgi:hypothetical protein